MYYYIIVKNVNLKDTIKYEIEDTLNDFYGKIIRSYQVDNKTLVYYIDGLTNKEYLSEYFNTLFNDHITKGLVYISNNSNVIKSFEQEIIIISKYIDDILSDNKLFVISISELITLTLKNNLNVDFKSTILKELFNDQTMKDTLNVFFDNDLNSLKTSKVLNIHRNTLNYRLNTFFDKTGLDPRKFNDAVIIKLML
ncbi:MAG TPA: helix-turn-helix domain-containing protein [Haploplasma sp.]|nr:helix-turn-helix domain-containing protein [Haploplasma sp.]